METLKNGLHWKRRSAVKQRIAIALLSAAAAWTAAGCGRPLPSRADPLPEVPSQAVSSPVEAETSPAFQPTTEAELSDASSGQTDAPPSPEEPPETRPPTGQLPQPNGDVEAPGEPEVPADLPAPEDFVLVTEYLPQAAVDLRYAGPDNFTGETIYDFSDAYLRYGTVEKLSQAQEALEEAGYSLLIWDAFRPTAAQFRLWEVCPDPVYVANPETGYSSHSRGNTVDVTLTDLDGNAVEMPSGFDDFSPLADRDYSDASPEAAANARLLEDVMTACGFRPYSGEWWHFTDTDDYPVEEVFSPG